MVTDRKVIEQIQEVFEELRPYFLMHGGNIELVKFEEGIVYVALHGACAGCPGSNGTLKLVVEQKLKEEVPQVQKVMEIEG